MKALLEQPNGLARRVVSKAGGNPTALLDATDAFIRRQPRVSGDSSQVWAALALNPKNQTLQSSGLLESQDPRLLVPP